MWRVTAVVDGEEVWFESADVPLAPAPEAMASAFYIPALLTGRVLAVDRPVCGLFAKNLRSVARTVSGWWGCPTHELAGAHHEAQARRQARTALCFSGGVDSFYSLLRHGQGTDVLVGLLGYDMKLEDADRIADFSRCVRAVAADAGKAAVIVATNLRQHHFFRRADWTRAHGGALAAVGHLLRGEVGTLQISASYPRFMDVPWGSRWDVDPHFSSASVGIAHVGDELRRSDKLIEIADDPLVRRHLRVCWENRGGQANCCRCEKCLRTMLQLAALGKLEQFTTFTDVGDMAAAIERQPPFRFSLLVVYRRYRAQLRDNRLRQALARWIWRSGGRPAWWHLAGKVKRWVVRRFTGAGRE